MTQTAELDMELFADVFSGWRMKYVGIDPSLTSTGVVMLDDDAEIIDSRVIKSRQKDAARLIEIENALWELLPNYVALEGYAMGSRYGREAAGELGGVIRRALYLQGSTYVVVPPASLKKFAAKGNAKKDEVRLEVYKRWGVEFETNDEVDAYVLARIAYAKFHGDDLIKRQQEVIDKLEVYRGV
ncbi:MAG: hypothetical protein ACOX6M_10255 [Armatimonadota bacterium]|jgi:crossover junction endodeoxyribonuclease RuvC